MATADASLPALGFDIEQLLAPVSADRPVGQDLPRMTVDGKSMLMAVIEEKRRAIISGANERLEPSQQVDSAALAQQRKSEWREVETMLTKAFAKGKELGAAVSFAQAAIMSRGWAAVGPCLSFLRLIQERFGDALYPVPETDDEGKLDYMNRLVLLERLDHENFLPLALRQLPITDSRSGGEFSWADFRTLEILKGTPAGKDEDPEARRQMIAERVKAFDDAVSKSSLAYYEALHKAIQNGVAELAALRSFVGQHCGGAPEEDQPNFRRTAEALEDCQALAIQYLKKKGGGQNLTQSDADQTAPGEAVEGDGEGLSAAASDRQVVGLLERALAHLRQHQHHNPAAYLVEEAIRWTRMPIASWYLEASEDPNMSAFISKLMRGRSTPDGGT